MGCRRSQPAGRSVASVAVLLRTWPWAAASADGVVRKAVWVDWHRPSPSQIGYRKLCPQWL